MELYNKTNGFVKVVKSEMLIKIWCKNTIYIGWLMKIRKRNNFEFLYLARLVKDNKLESRIIIPMDSIIQIDLLED